MLWKKLPVFVALSLVASISASLGMLERNGDQVLSRISAGQGDDPAAYIDLVPFSSSATQEMLLGCDVLVSGISMGISAGIQNEAILEGCAQIASEIIHRQPTSSLAHYVLAKLALLGADQATYSASLSKSQNFGLHEGWLVLRRLKLIMGNVDSGEFGDQITRESIAMLSFQSGAQELVVQYSRKPLIRKIMPAILERVSVGDAQRFVNILKNSEYNS